MSPYSFPGGDCGGSLGLSFCFVRASVVLPADLPSLGGLGYCWSHTPQTWEILMCGFCPSPCHHRSHTTPGCVLASRIPHCYAIFSASMRVPCAAVHNNLWPNNVAGAGTSAPHPPWVRPLHSREGLAHSLCSCNTCIPLLAAAASVTRVVMALY